MQVHEFWPQFAGDCILVDEMTAVNTTRWEFAEGTRGAATGFSGTVGFSLIPKGKIKASWQEYWEGAATVMQSLAQFAFYSGVGHHTTIGMGQCRPLPNSQSATRKETRSHHPRT
ncbi:MAG: CRISPR system precrRNA processing endoribonuclease RAMP protein Cas6 [Chloroflexi bacterium]|nr:CRISPR system precrRNA processing endoribonuclease RAMP protein Cas6 [Chloroflexota bacterium]